MKNKPLSVLLGGIVLVAAAFLLLDFRVAMSSTQDSNLIFTTGDAGNMPLPMQRRDKIDLVLVGDGPLLGPLQAALLGELSQAGLGQVELLQELAPAYPNPLLLVKVVQPGPTWTPFYAASRFSIHAGYASNGDSTFMQAAEQTHTSVAQKDAAIMYAEFDVSDRSLGLISRPAYYRSLAGYLARETVTALKGLYHQ